MLLTLEIKDNEADFFIKLVKQFNFVKVKETAQNETIAKQIKEGLEEMKLVKQGKLKAINIEDVLENL